MASLTLARGSAFADRLRSYTVVLDGESIGEIGDGEARTFAIAPGQHNLVVNIDWCGSKPVTFAAVDGEEVKFAVTSNLVGAKRFLALWYVAFRRDSYLKLRHVENLSGLAVRQKPLRLNRTRFILVYGVLGFGGLAGLIWILAVHYLFGFRLLSPIGLFALIVWLGAGYVWGARMWTVFSRRFAGEVEAINARLATGPGPNDK